MRYLLAVFFFTSIMFPQSVYHSGKFKKQNSEQWRIINTGLDFTPIDICFPDSINGWVIGNYEIANTTDGGETWTKQVTPVDTINFRKIYFVNKLVGFILGDEGLILTTKDGGALWKKTESGVTEKSYLMGISFINENNGWISGSDNCENRWCGVVLTTSDGGETWNVQTDLFTGIIHY
ncbi:MAG: hypothetical protein F9K45_12815, partial [Melioribacteraceae bacterium]